MIPHVQVRLPAVALLLVFFSLLLLLPGDIAKMLWLLASWYFLMSFADWALHRFVLHDDRSIVPHWRRGHRKHHVEFDTGVGRSGTSLTFPHGDASLIALATMPLGLLVGLSLAEAKPFPLLCIALAHVAGITLVVGVHNYAHSAFHGYPIPGWSTHAVMPVPQFVLEVLHAHHERHHEDAGCNYCTVLLGFDSLAGTSYDDGSPLGASCFWPHRHWSHIPQAHSAGKAEDGKPSREERKELNLEAYLEAHRSREGADASAPDFDGGGGGVELVRALPTAYAALDSKVIIV